MLRQPRSTPEISFIIAVRDDEERIGHLVQAICAHVRSLGRTFEIVAVNDGSRDNSLPMLELLAARTPELRIRRTREAGRAFLRGSAQAAGGVLVLLVGLAIVRRRITQHPKPRETT